MKNLKYIITGAPGTGKTSIINELEKRKFYCVHENAREIIAEQIVNGGNILPWKDQIAFEKKIANLRVKHYLSSPRESVCFFDRSVIDCIAYLKSNNLEISAEIIKNVKITCFNNTVFYTPLWEDIYLRDNERKEDIKEARKIEKNILDTYQSQGYKLVEIPKTSVIERTNFIISNI